MIKSSKQISDLSAEVAQAETLRSLIGVDTTNIRRPKRKLQNLRQDIQNRNREINAEQPGALDNSIYTLSRELFDANALIESSLQYASKAPAFDPSLLSVNGNNNEVFKIDLKGRVRNSEL